MNITRSLHFKSLVVGSAVLLFTTAVGTLGYHYIGRPHATWIDSFYMTFITVATIGYSETVDLTHHPYGRLFTVAIAFVGIVTVSFLLSTLVATLVDPVRTHALRRKRMEKRIAACRGHYIVCGVGRVGSNVAHELLKTRRPFVVIEADQDVLHA